MSQHIPIIDIPLLQSGDTQQQQALVEGLGHWGLIHIANHGIDPELLDQFYAHFHQ